MAILHIIFLLGMGYLLGSIPFGVLVARACGVDIRTAGSGNIGATNVGRVLGARLGFLVFGLDMLKGTLAVGLAQWIFPAPWLVLAVGIAAFLGHLFPVFASFRGGRGSAVGLGFLLGIAPDIFLVAIILVVLLIALTRYVSVASLVSSVVVTALFFSLGRPWAYGLSSLIVMVLIWVRHIPNIRRLLAGTENKIGWGE